jgi:hypothetical protein
MTAHLITEAELAEMHPTCLAVLQECSDSCLKTRYHARSVWHVKLKNGTEHHLVLRANGEAVCVEESCPDRPCCPAVLRFSIRAARERNGDHSLLYGERTR